VTAVAATTAIAPPRSHARTSLPPVGRRMITGLSRDGAVNFEPSLAPRHLVALPLDDREVGLDGDAPFRAQLVDDKRQLMRAVQADQHSVVKIEGRGCGGIVEGSGFVAKTGIVLTNAHVVAGVSRPQVVDVNGEYSATVVLFDPNLDLAVLRVDNLKDAPLPIDSNTAPNGTPAAVLGYPGGGDLHIGTARILQSLEAMGRNIYGQGTTTRLVYSVKATVRPGNSGGPLIAKNGNVIGIVFAESTVNDQTGYALAMHAVSAELAQGATRTLAVGTGACAE